ncbi:MAG TPA: glycosyltransferase family A protein [Solirubrobacteraceae bacterium]|nr:glycosyltransferase family A protein [Solirubrobacteraceae bacterium]
MPHVSVIVPVYNPGSDIDDLIDSLLGQSLPPEDLELIFVDDGSTDATPQRLDALAAGHAHVRVRHIPNSGWPGRPRNVGLDLARGEHVLFADNDDWLGREALERLHATALRDDADVVVGKVVGHGKFVPRGLFSANRRSVTLAEWPALLGLLTPHKLFRRTLLDEHGIRFPEGRRRLEDHMFVVHALFHARAVSVLADYPCYHWVRRDADANASYRPFEAVGYYQNVREVLDLVDEHTEPGPLRDRLSAHWYRGKMLGRVGGPYFLRRDADHRRELHREVRRLALERYSRQVDAGLPLNLRVRSHLLREATYESLEALAAVEDELRAKPALRHLSRQGDAVVLRVEASLVSAGKPLSFVRRAGRLLWIPPAPLHEALPPEALDATEELPASRAQLFLRSTADRSEYVIPGQTEVRLEDADGPGERVRAVLLTEARLVPATAAAGSPLPPGDWEVFAVVTVAGFSTPRRVRGPGDDPLTLIVDPAGRVVERRTALSRRVAHRVPWAARLARRARAAAGR